MTRIIIIDDHKLFSDGLAALLEKDANFAVIAQIYDSREALSKVNELKSDLVIADFNMPYINGLSLTKILLAANPDLKILILSMYNEERFVKDFKDAGAMGYLTKTTEIQEVKQGILAIVSGKSVFPQLVTNQDSIYNQDLFLKKFSLSIREKEVVDLMLKGISTRQIANQLNISYYTAETHRKNIYTKLGIKGGERSLVNLMGIQN